MGLFDIPPNAPTTSTRGSDFWLADGIIFGRTRAQAPHGELLDAVNAVERIRQLIENTPRPLLFDARQVGWLQFKAREHVHQHAGELFTRAAVVVKGPMLRVLRFGMLGLGGRLDIPVEIFVEADDALQFAIEGPSE